MFHQCKTRGGRSPLLPALPLLLGCGAVLALGSCHGSTTGTKFTSATGSSEARQGSTVELTYRTALQGATTADVFADVDGDLGTTGDQVLIEAGRPVVKNKTERVFWDTKATPADTYQVLVVFHRASDAKLRVLTKSFRVNAAPVVVIVSPDTGFVARTGGVLEIRYTDDDPDDIAITRLFADRDGNPVTTADQYPISTLPDADGGQRLVRWDTEGIPFGNYRILAESQDTIPLVERFQGPGVEIADHFVGHLGAITPGNLRLGGPVLGKAVLALEDGGSVFSGSFQDQLTADGARPILSTNAAVSDQDAFLIRLDTEGRIRWAVGSQSPPDSIGFPAQGDALARRPDGSLVMAGSYRGTKTFGSTTLESSCAFPDNHVPTEDAFVACYGSDGSFRWAATAGGPGKDRVLGVAALSDGTVFVGGVFEQELLIGAGEPNQTLLTSAGLFFGTREIFLARFDASGRLLWAERAGSVEDDDLTGLAVLSDDSIVLTGSFRAEASFGTDPPAVILSSMGERDGFVARYRADGSFLWARSIGGASDVHANAIAVFENDSIVVVGQASGDVDFGNGFVKGMWLDPFLARYSAGGALEWAAPISTSNGGEAHAVCTTPDGAAIVAGQFDGIAVFGSGIEVNAWTLPGELHHDAFFARYELGGTPSWALAAGGIGDDQGLGIAAWQDGTPIATGKMKARARFAPGPWKVHLPCFGSQDGFAFAMHARGLAIPGGGSGAYAGDHPLTPVPTTTF